MKKILLCLILVFCFVIITACGNSNMKALAGTYKQEYSKYVGDPDTAKDTTEVASIELNEDGTGKSNRNGTSYNIEWKVDGENITLTETFMGMKIEYNGTIKDGKLDLFNGDKTNALTNETVYNKE